MKKWIFIISVLFVVLLSPQLVFSNELMSYELELVDEKGNIHIQTVTLEIRGGEAYFQGDIFVGYVLEDGTISEKPFEKSDDGMVSPFTVISSSNRWGTTIPYSVNGLTTTAANAVRQAMDTLESVSGLNFVVRTNQDDYIYFEYHADDFCSSPVGRKGGAQRIRLSDYCSTSTAASQRTIMHEIMHSLGFYHEHSRYDRDDWVIVHIDNILPEKRKNFDKVTSNFEYLTPYDKRSIMHYFRFTSSSDFVYDTSLPMLSDKSDPDAALSGLYLSDLDIQGLQVAFGALPKPFLTALPAYCYGQVELTWDSIQGASEYKISYGVNTSSNETPYTLTTTANTSHIVWTANESRIYSVRACNGDGACSLSSNQVYVHYYSSCM